MAKKETTEETVPQAAETKAPEPERKRYGSFHEAWKNVQELRIWCRQEGQPRFGLDDAGMRRANELIREYQNG